MLAMRFIRISRTLGFALLTANIPFLAWGAQTYPTHPIRLVVPLAAGGANGIIGTEMVRVAKIPGSAH